MKICPNCGNLSNDNDKFCQNCGFSFPMSTGKQGNGSDEGLPDVAKVIISVVLAVLVLGAGFMIVGRVLDSTKDKPTAVTEETIPTAEPGNEEAEPGNEEAEPGNEEQEHAYDFPAGTLSYNGHYYYIYDDIDGSWDDAMEACLDRGGYLAVINDSGENEALYEYMLEQGFDQAYFGMTDRQSEGVWTYTGGDVSIFTDWGKNSVGTREPNNADGGESYAMLDSHMSDGHWNDAQFGRQVYTPEGEAYKNRTAYICEWDY